MATVLLVSASRIFCLNKMFNWLYRLPLSYVITLTVVCILLWGLAFHKFSGRKYGIKAGTLNRWKIVNFILLILTLAFILSFTLISRKTYVDVLVLKPFYSFEIASYHSEMYRSLIMNVVLFVPFGLFFSCVLSDNLKRWIKIIFTTFSGCFLSILIESIQYFFKLGEAWTDDVIFNTLGAFWGSMALIVWKLYYLKNNYK